MLVRIQSWGLKNLSDFYIASEVHFQQLQSDGFKDYRKGQAMFNKLLEHRPDLSSRIISTEFDPYYNDNKIPKLQEWLKLNWENKMEMRYTIDIVKMDREKYKIYGLVKVHTHNKRGGFTCELDYVNMFEFEVEKHSLSFKYPKGCPHKLDGHTDKMLKQSIYAYYKAWVGELSLYFWTDEETVA